MKNTFKGVLPPLAALVLGCVLLAGCEDIIKGPPPAPPEAPDLGGGRLVITIGGGTERTLIPRADQFSKITLSFERKNGTGTMPDLEAGLGETVITLNPGTWELTAEAWNAADPPAVAARAQNTLTRDGDIVSGNRYFALAPAGAGPGVLRYTVAPPEGVTLNPDLSRIRIEQDGELAAAPALDGETVSLKPGRYVADILLAEAGGVNTAAFIESVVILPGLITDLVFKPGAGDFLDPEARALLTDVGGVRFGLTKNNGSKTVVGPAGGAAPSVTQELSVPNGTETLYFTLSKARAQTVTPGGESGEKVRVAVSGTVDGHAASPTLAVLTVDSSALPAAGGTMEFTLTLGENGKTPVVYRVAVNAAVLTYLHIGSYPSKRVYLLGEDFDPTGLSLWEVYADGERRVAAEGYTVKGFDSSVAGDKLIEIEKYGVPARQYAASISTLDTRTNEDLFVRGSIPVYFDRILAEGIAIEALSPSERALVFWHGLTADYESQPNRYTLPAGRTLVLAPVKFYIPDNAVYEWKVDGVTQPGHTTEYFPYTAAGSSGEHTVRVAAKVDGAEIAGAATTVVSVSGAVPRPKQTGSNAKAEKLYTVVAPGQFGSGSDRLGSLHGAGAFGGYPVFKFDHSVMKQPGGEELSIGGNAFYGWLEPGVIWVSQDDNRNGLPDDTWYELQGSHTFAPTTLRRHAVTFRKSDFTWVDNLGNGGEIQLGRGCWPVEAPPSLTEMTLVGTELPLANEMWGYADVVDNGRVSLSNAIQEDGTPVDLDFIDFLKIVTALHRYEPLFGERSTESNTPVDRSLGDPDKHVGGKSLGNNQYEYAFTNNSGYDLTVEILEGVGEKFELKAGAKVVKTLTGKSEIYIDYYGGNVTMHYSAGNGAIFSNG
jgi:hypothetical protein